MSKNHIGENGPFPANAAHIIPEPGMPFLEQIHNKSQGDNKSVPANKDSGFPLKHIWEIKGFLKCPVIGSSLCVNEHRRILNKAGYPTKRKTPYQLHQAIMANLDSRNPISVKVDNYLRYKYRNAVDDFKGLEEEAIMEKWRMGLETGNTAPIFYVAAVRKDLSANALEEIFGDIHMINHANLNEVNKSGSQLAMQVDANQKLARLLRRQKDKTGNGRKEISFLKASLKEAYALLDKLRLSCKAPEANDNERVELQVQNQKMKQTIQIFKQKIEKLSGEKKQMERKMKQLQIRVFELRAANDNLTEELKNMISQFSSYVECDEQCNKQCPKLHLCAKRILIVGGIIRMKKLYRDLVESSGGHFEYHDGYMHNGKQNLENRIRRSDLVLCPVNCNSHNASNKVKKLCQKYRKPVRMLSNSSLTAISNAMFEGLEKRN